jgi:hypothetical protein
MATTYYSGPGKLYRNSVALWPDAGGLLKYEIAQEKDEVTSAMHGRIASTLGDTIGKISLTPFDNWGALAALFPSYLGVTVGASVGALLIGQRPHNPFTAGTPANDTQATIWNPVQTNKIVIARTAVTKHPDLHLGVGKPLFGSVELTALPSTTSGAVMAIGTAGALHSITESGASDPGANFITSDFIREAWTGAWGTFGGFGGDGGSAMQAEEEWMLTSEVKYSPLKVQKQTVHLKLDSVQFMIKARLTLPTWTQIEAQVLTGRPLGARWGNPGAQGVAADLLLTSAITGKTIALKNADVMSEGFEFGGTKLGTGEVGFVNQITFSAGAPQPLLVFSA